MTYFTGDIHGDPRKIAYFCNRQELTQADVLVILGDFGANYSGGRRDELMKSMMAQCFSVSMEITNSVLPIFRAMSYGIGVVEKFGFRRNIPIFYFLRMKRFSKLVNTVIW